MNRTGDEPFIRVVNTSAHDLSAIESDSIHCCVTSPPYWGLRAYKGEQLVEWPSVTYSAMPGQPPMTFPGSDVDCEHEWGAAPPAPVNRAGNHPDRPSGFQQNSAGGESGALAQMRKKVGRNDAGEKRPGFHGSNNRRAEAEQVVAGEYCQLCGAWRGPLGLEPTPEMFVGHLLLVFRGVWRVLRPEGTLWVNMGDTYAANRATGELNGGVKPKDLMGIPWRLAFALQADGWYLRSDVPWIKKNAMPESVEDRPTKGHEYMFLCAKQEDYYYDIEAIRQAYTAPLNRWGGDKLTAKGASARDEEIGQEWYRDRDMRPNANGRQRRTTDWWFESLDEQLKHLTYIKEHGGMVVDSDGDPVALQVNPVSYSGAHYAVFPPKLVEPCILAGTSQRGACPTCGAPWRRVMFVERENYKTFDHPERTGGAISGGVGKNFPETTRETIGWWPTCDCYHPGIETEDEEQMETVPCKVLDPFAGSGTTGMVAVSLNRAAVLVDISQEYLEKHVPDRTTVQRRLL